MAHGVRYPDAVRDEFWRQLRCCGSVRLASEAAGVALPAAKKWMAQRGGVIPRPSRAGGPEVRYQRLNAEERETIALMLAAGRCDAEIARELGRHRSTIGRERRRHTRAKVGYRPLSAQREATARAQRSHRRPAKLASPGPLRDYVVAGLGERWSPAEIAARIRVDHHQDAEMRVCAETIYQALYVQARGGLKKELLAPDQALRRGRGSRRPRSQWRYHSKGGESGRGRLIDTVPISQRPAEVEDRAVPGHWEGDLILGQHNASAIGTLVERTSRFVILIHLPGRRRAEDLLESIVPAISELPPLLRRSLTWDNGKEMALHKQITMATDMNVYFADPHSPWQRGSNENTNGLLRQYFPKSTSLRIHSPADLAAVATQLNGRPRKTLGWATPAEKLNEILGHPYKPPVLH